MSRPPREEGSPLVLLVNDEEWAARSIETVLQARGYGVLRSYTGTEALELAAKVHADCVLVDYGLPDMNGQDLCARLRSLSTIRDSTPLIVISSRALPRRVRLACLESGAWDVLKLPFDAVEFFPRLERYLAAKRDVNAALESGHEDPLTGLYNLRGLEKRLTEILAEAVRHDHPLACVALALAPEGPAPLEASRSGRTDSGATASRPAAEVLARGLSEATRVSDVVARVGDDEYLIIAPSTDERGVQRLTARLFERLGGRRTAQEPADEKGIDLRAGYLAVEHPEPGELRPEDLLQRATLALRQAQTDADRIRRFDATSRQ